jgi:hypothetical protein
LALIPLLIVGPAGAFVDDEPANDSIATAAIQMVKTGVITTQGGELSFDPTDTDYLGVGGLVAGDIVTVSTTPLDDSPSLEDPDTIVGLFKFDSTMICVNDDAYNNDLDPFPTGFGSLCRFDIREDGDYFVGLTGFSAVPFDGNHVQSGNYEVTVTVTSAGTPDPASVLTDDEPANDSIAGAAIQMVKSGAVTTEGGKFSLVAGDTDYLGVGGLRAGDIITISTTPLDDPPDLRDPDTMVGLFKPDGTKLCVGDDAFNNDLDRFPRGFGSLCRFDIRADGDYFVGVTGFSSVPFDGKHYESGDYEVTVSVTSAESPFIIVGIDIKPGSDPNSINPSLGGVLAVAILGSDRFDTADVDVATLAFGPSAAPFDHSHGPHFEDVNGDGYMDLVSHYLIEATGISFGDMAACVVGETVDGWVFEGCDSVRTVPDMDGDRLLDAEEIAIGTNGLNRDTDKDGFDDDLEVLVMGTDPLDRQDPTPVPEPASWPMLVAGAALLGLLCRRRARGLRLG